MKKIICILGTMFTALLLMACNSLSFSGSRMGNDSQLIMKYSIFNTTDSQYFEMDQGDVIDADIVSDSGKLSVTVQSEDGETVYENEDVPTGVFQIEIKKKGIYKIKVTGKKAKGSLSFIKSTEQDSLEANLAALSNSYYEAQSSRAYQMLQKSIFKKLLLNGWLDEISGMENARWNYDTFTKYTVLDRDQIPDEDQGELYCCTFSADNDRCGYIVISYSGDGLSKYERLKLHIFMIFCRNGIRLRRSWRRPEWIYQRPPRGERKCWERTAAIRQKEFTLLTAKETTIFTAFHSTWKWKTENEDCGAG